MKITHVQSQVIRLPAVEALADGPVAHGASRDIVILTLGTDAGIEGIAGQPIGQKGCSMSRSLQNMAQIGQESVGNVDGRRGQAPQSEPQIYPGLGPVQGIEAAGPGRFLQKATALQMGKPLRWPWALFGKVATTAKPWRV